MPSDLIVEDGTGKTDANSYQSVVEADLYMEDHNDPVPTTWSDATTFRKEVALRNATQYLDLMYVLRWKGTRTNETQALDWPRNNVVDPSGFAVDNDAMPQVLLDATVELAFRDITETLGILPDVVPGSSQIKKEMKKVGPLEKEIEYFGIKREFTRFTIVENLLRELLDPIRMERG